VRYAATLSPVLSTRALQRFLAELRERLEKLAPSPLPDNTHRDRMRINLRTLKEELKRPMDG
jgi:hypothetical protein